jgi:hypothetical protein
LATSVRIHFFKPDPLDAATGLLNRTQEGRRRSGVASIRASYSRRAYLP